MVLTKNQVISEYIYTHKTTSTLKYVTDPMSYFYYKILGKIIIKRSTIMEYYINPKK